jgi:molybdopterin-guanine dinucleotide biosynthesis protein B
MRFDLVAVVDWSASSARPHPKPRADAIWLGLATSGDLRTSYHPSRHAAEGAIGTLIDMALDTGQSLLVGFDFPMGYPDNFAARLTGRAAAPAVWQWLDAAITDGPDNRNNRFAVADAINQRLGGQGPFWGRPESQPLPHLPSRKMVDYPGLGLEERRQVEKLVPRAQPVWKLYTTGAAGGQSLMGLPMIHRLAQRPGIAVWPFDPPARVTLAEIYPSLLAPSVTAALGPGAIKDEVQVRLLAQSLWRLGQAGQLEALLAAAPPDVRRAEGWILGAGAAQALRAVL